jgi:DNA (cytosine-5)-methyltransferase 1
MKLVDTTTLKYDPSTEKKLKVISLFSCCGGMDLGFEGGFTIFGQKYHENPFEVVFASDYSKPTTDTYNKNFKSAQSLHLDINKLNTNDLPEADIVIGGFPCQPFSLAGKRGGFNDHKNRGMLYLQMKRVIDAVKPKMFIAENVDGLKSAKDLSTGVDRKALDIIVEDFEKSGYKVEYKVLHAVDYGVPQTRVRVIIIGKRKDLKGDILFPMPTHSKNGEDGLPKYRTAKDAIGDLEKLLDDPKAPANHTTADYSKSKFFPGKNYQGNQKESADKPAHTVRAEAHGNVYGHYNSLGDDPNNEDMKTWRRLTVRECARIQTFPDSFIFPVAQSEAHRQIGNAVPPVLAWHIARSVALALK